MEYLLIYLLQSINIFTDLAIVSGIFLFLFLITCLIMCCCTKWQFKNYEGGYLELSTEAGRNFWNFVEPKFKKTVVICIIFLIMGYLFPTKQTLILMSGAYYGKQVIKSEKVQKINNIIDLELDKILKDLKKELNNG